MTYKCTGANCPLEIGGVRRCTAKNCEDRTPPSMTNADVVSVVRCKECKYYDPPGDSEEDCGRCMNWDMPVCGDDATTFNPDPDFFCAFGLAE